jgi:hypothetical protein
MNRDTESISSELRWHYNSTFAKNRPNDAVWVSEHPLFPDDFPDPTALYCDDGKILVLGTQGPTTSGSIQRSISLDQGRTWSKIDTALTADNGCQLWAPELLAFPVNGKNWFTYTEVNATEGISRLRLASANSPTDAFVPHPTALIEGRGIHHLDPFITFDPLSDSLILIEGSGWNEHDGIRLWRLNPETMSVEGEPYQVIENDPSNPEANLWEAGMLQVVPDARYPYQLHFSGTDYKRNYRGHLRVAKKLDGPYIQPPEWPDDVFLSDGPEMILPGQVSFFLYNLFIYHAVEVIKQDLEQQACIRRCRIQGIQRDSDGLPVPMRA